MLSRHVFWVSTMKVRFLGNFEKQNRPFNFKRSISSRFLENRTLTEKICDFRIGQGFPHVTSQKHVRLKRNIANSTRLEEMKLDFFLIFLKFCIWWVMTSDIYQYLRLGGPSVDLVEPGEK